MSHDPKKPAAPEAKKEPTVTELVAQALKEALPLAVVAAMQAQQGSTAANAQALQEAKLRSAERCFDCGQVKTACGGEHMKMVVYPRNEEYGPWFPGIRLNGVVYLSNNATHEITVPKVNDFGYQLATWEKNERELKTGRKGHHNSGSVGPGHHNFSPANQGWR